MEKAENKGIIHKFILKPDRLLALVDGIFAFAMTLLVINIEVPKVSVEQLPQAICADWQNFKSYILSFLLLGVFWLQHQRLFNSIERVNESFIWLNIFNMMFVVFIPFSSSLVGSYGNFSVFSNLVFNGNLLIVGLINCLLIQSAYKGKLVGDTFSYNIQLYKCLMIPLTSIAAIILSFFCPSYSALAYLAIPLMLRIFPKYSKR